MKSIFYTAFLLSTLMLSSCGGGGATNENYSTTTTLGQELSDLDKAHKDGVINDSEYEKSKKKLLNRKQ